MVLIPEMPAVGRGFISRLEKYTFDNPAWTVPKEKVVAECLLFLQQQFLEEVISHFHGLLIITEL